jgi:PAN domain
MQSLARRLLKPPQMKHLVIALALAVAAASAHATTFTDRLQANQYLFAGGSIVEPSCFYRVTFQSDGNLVMYDAYGHVNWASGTNGSGAGYATMQADGNFVLYRWDGTPVWATGTNGWGTSIIRVQGDGNFVVYWGSWAIWASNSQTNNNLGTTNCPRTGITTTEQNTNRFGGDYTGFPISQPRPLWCAYYCAEDYRCKAYTYVPPGVQGPSAMCWLKSTVPGTSYAPGLVSGTVDDFGY